MCLVMYTISDWEPGHLRGFGPSAAMASDVPSDYELTMTGAHPANNLSPLRPIFAKL
jgi:hypothetical protein